jgi:hypothetical protein
MFLLLCSELGFGGSYQLFKGAGWALQTAAGVSRSFLALGLQWAVQRADAQHPMLQIPHSQLLFCIC